MQTKNQSFDSKTKALLASLMAGESRTLTLISTFSLSEKETQAIVSQLGLEKMEDLNVENEVDESILGGLIVKYNGYYLDLSLKTKLEQIVGNLN